MTDPAAQPARRQLTRAQKVALFGLVALVILLLLVLVPFVLVNVTPPIAAQTALARAFVGGGLTTALTVYSVNNGGYPTTQQGLAALVTRPAISPLPTNWAGPYITGLPIDPWGRPYQYLCPGIHNSMSFDVFSMGPDGIAGTVDDIGNWPALTNTTSTSTP